MLAPFVGARGERPMTSSGQKLRETTGTQDPLSNGRSRQTPKIPVHIHEVC